MPIYQNIYLQEDSNAKSISMNLGEPCYCFGDMDLTLTWVTDPSFSEQHINAEDFKQAITIGSHCYIENLNRLAFHNGPVKLTSVKVNNRVPGKIQIGNGVALQGTAIVAYEKVVIEDNVTFGPGVTIMDSNGHPIRGRGTEDEASHINSSPVIIKQGAWIGLNAIILKGVTIGENAVIGAGSVVSQSIPDNAIAMGNPAKVVKIITPEQAEAYSQQYAGL
ncbi:MAG: acetyltransferase-like isoleucine patch superfamily enzyme [Alteromonadaceae bacterium]|jgi:acetyltransferase-like isoleucine patch superfamily enzyme